MPSPRLLARNGLTPAGLRLLRDPRGLRRDGAHDPQGLGGPRLLPGRASASTRRSAPSTGAGSTSTAPRSPPATPSPRRAGASSPRSPSSSRRPAEAAASSPSALPVGRASSRSWRREHERPLHDHRQLARGQEGRGAAADPAAPLRARSAAVRGAGARRRWRALRRRHRGLARGVGVATVAAAESVQAPTAGQAQDKVGAVVLDLSAAVDPAELDQLRLLGAPAVKALKRNGRVVVIGTDPATLTDVAEVTTQRALEGAVRSIGKELRRGRTANLVLAQGDAHDGVRSAVEFFLSGRSAYVDGQVVRVDESTSGDVDALPTPRRQGGRRHRRRPRHRCRDRPRAGPRRRDRRRRRRARGGGRPGCGGQRGRRAPRSSSTSRPTTPGGGSSSTPRRVTAASTSSCTTPASPATSSSSTWTTTAGAASWRSTSARSCG